MGETNDALSDLERAIQLDPMFKELARDEKILTRYGMILGL